MAEIDRQPAREKNEEEIIIPDPTRQALLRSRTRVRIEKAQKILEYQPRYSFEDSMALTHEF